MSSKATRYPISFKKEAVLNYLQFKISTPESTMNDFLTKFNYSFAVSCFHKWKQLFKDEIMSKYQLPLNTVENKYGSNANELTLPQKQKIIMEVAKFTEEQIGEYCRSNGLYASDIAEWKVEIEQALMMASSTTGSNNYNEKELRQNNLNLLRKNRELEEKLKRKDKIIDRKNASLAEYAAKVVTLTNFNQLFEDHKDRKSTRLNSSHQISRMP